MTDFLSSPLLNRNKHIKHRFFNHLWGIPRDDEILKKEKLSAVARMLRTDPTNLITLNQVHSSNYTVVTGAFTAEIPKADAMITNTPGLLLGILTADCVPILLSCKTGLLVAAIHAGWRGALTGIIENTVQKMLSMGAKDIDAALGPCIWQESYEVSNDFYENLSDGATFFVKGQASGFWQFDLPGFVQNKLLTAGVRRIEPSLANTYSDTRFFSFRRTSHFPEQELKSNLSVIGVM